ncbi:hypothetical protein E4U43_005679 [Claviceps pusilla]|uniref:Chitin biosynthesis protein CHS5 n=1 Tax=Claviceps pusilla TaxID=123648 RepID=A0A9P7NF84_9HYPO|nr:hypothetical protein E4U43_005679 [Claviceps pusilla]
MAFSTDTYRSPNRGIRANYGARTVKRFVPEDIQRFVQPDGKLMTSREMRDFLVEHNIEPDNGRMIRLEAGPELSRVASNFSAQLAYSPEHVLHPQHLRFFEPRGHPLGPKIRAHYARKKQEQPLWIFITAFGGNSAVVRSLTQRKLTRSIYQALNELGYQTRTSGVAVGDKVRGTLWITLHDPCKASTQSPERFGRVVANALAALSHESARNYHNDFIHIRHFRLRFFAPHPSHQFHSTVISIAAIRLNQKAVLAVVTHPPCKKSYQDKIIVPIRGLRGSGARMLVSLTVGKVDAGVTVLLTPDKRLIEFPSILLPPNISSGSIVDIAVSQNTQKETAEEQKFRALQDRIFHSFGASEPTNPALRCRNATQTSVVLEWDPIELATADLISLSLYRNGQKAGNIPRPLQMHSTKISGLAVDTEYTFYLVLRTTAGTRTSEKVTVRTHKMTDLSGVTITTGIMPPAVKENLIRAVERIGAKIVDGVRIDTTHLVTTEGRGTAWEKAVETNIPVVRPEWVDACEKNGRILGVTKFYLDAMRPGPPSQDQIFSSPSRAPAAPAAQPAPAPPPKDESPLADTPSKADEATPNDQRTEGLNKVGDEGNDETDKKDDMTENAKNTEHEPGKSPKAAPQQPDDQKMSLEDKEEQTMARRPSVSSGGGEAMNHDHQDKDEGEGPGEGPGEGQAEGQAEEGGATQEAEEKPVVTPDGASFQEVEL